MLPAGITPVVKIVIRAGVKTFLTAELCAVFTEGVLAAVTTGVPAVLKVR